MVTLSSSPGGATVAKAPAPPDPNLREEELWEEVVGAPPAGRVEEGLRSQPVEWGWGGGRGPQMPLSAQGYRLDLRQGGTGARVLWPPSCICTCASMHPACTGVCVHMCAPPEKQAPHIDVGTHVCTCESALCTVCTCVPVCPCMCAVCIHTCACTCTCMHAGV